MGNRVSIQFANGNEKSVVLFDHWGGIERVKHAMRYAQNLKEELIKNGNPLTYPLDRLEPNTVMIDYIRFISQTQYNKNERIKSTLYLGKDESDGDNSDNGHFIINFKE